MRGDDLGGEEDQGERGIDPLFGIIQALHTDIYFVFEVIFKFSGQKIGFVGLKGQQPVLP